jgi:hypothetical protein
MSVQPIRLRLSRRKGFDLAAASLAANGLPARVVARPTKWGNPFIVGKHGTAADCVRYHALAVGGWFLLESTPTIAELQAHVDFIRANVRELAGHNLACWCALDKPCHADTLLRLGRMQCEEVVAEARAGLKPLFEEIEP